MSSIGKAVVFIFSIAGIANPSSAWTYRDENNIVATKSTPVQLTDGDRVDQGVIKHEFSVRVLVTQVGKASTWDHPIDNRQCTINIFSNVTRNVCFATILGDQSCHNKWSVPLPQTAKYVPKKANSLDYDPCNKYHDKIDELKRQVMMELSEDIDIIYKDDLEILKSEWAGLGVGVTYEN